MAAHVLGSLLAGVRAGSPGGKLPLGIVIRVLRSAFAAAVTPPNAAARRSRCVHSDKAHFIIMALCHSGVKPLVMNNYSSGKVHRGGRSLWLKPQAWCPVSPLTPVDLLIKPLHTEIKEQIGQSV
uniref:Uncharacterized protein n=1 Tax=Knipowitschia caucasica TaxID=637954 RepID=A0AAV2M6X0_KNICA